MTAASISGMIVPSLALVAACSAAIVFGLPHLRREPPPETTTASVAPLLSPSASGAHDQSPPVATAQTEAKSVADQLAVSPPTPFTGDSLPAFDVARIERSGDAVIAGRAAPGATVELLRDGQHLDQAVADPSGQFVMVPPPLPPGKYELSLRSRLPDGTLAISQHRVAVALEEAPSSASTLQSHAEVPPGAQQAAVASRPQPDEATSPPPHVTVATAAPEPVSVTAAAEPKSAKRVVSRGDSLWRISRITYGDGARYAVVYRANRERIRDPNRIYPGQIFVLPSKSN